MEMQPLTDVLPLAWKFAVALFIGALIGIEREHQAGDEPGQFGGLRTFVLCALVGALAGWIDGRFGLQAPVLLVSGMFALSALLAVGVYLEGRLIGGVPGLTTELAALATYLLGALVTLGHAELAVMLAIAVLALLALKGPLHGAVRAIDRDDLIAGLKLLAATFIVLPLLPDRAIDPWGALNPWRLWWLVILISFLSLVGYAAVRLIGARRGIFLTGIFGGLVSSTAITLSFARRSREAAGLGPLLAIGILLAWSIMFARVIVEVSVVNRALLEYVWAPVAAMLAAGVVVVIVLWRRTIADPPAGQGARSAAGDVHLKNPFSLTAAIQFGALFAVVLVLVKVVRDFAPEGGMVALAALAGATDVDAITLSLAESAREGLDSRIATVSILVACWSNTAVKGVMVFVLGSRQLGRTVLLAGTLISAAGGIVYLALPIP